MRRKLILGVILLAALSAAGVYLLKYYTPQHEDTPLRASGTITIEEIQVGTEVGGKVISVSVGEGDSVKAGDPLVQLDPGLVEAQRLQAEKNLASLQGAAAASRENLALLQAGPSAEQIRLAQSQLEVAEANRKAVEASLFATSANARPEDLDAAWAQLTLARQEYYGLRVVLTAAQMENVLATRSTAQKNLSQAEARAKALAQDTAISPSAIQAAQETVSDFTLALDSAASAYDLIQDTGQPFYLQIEAARKCWDVAELNLSAVKARQVLLDSDPDMEKEGLDAAKEAVDEAQELADEAENAYKGLADSDQAAQLKTTWERTQQALRQLVAKGRGGTTPLETLLNQLAAAAAQRDAAEANLELVESGTRPEQLRAAKAGVAAAEAQVGAAQAALGVFDVQIKRLHIQSPANGIILTRAIQPGEIALPGSTLLVLGLMDEKTITVYLPEEKYGLIQLGQQADILVDSSPGVVFKGQVVRIADRAEFTPRNVQTAEGRKNTVFAIDLKITSPDERLKPGMPADVTFQP